MPYPPTWSTPSIVPIYPPLQGDVHVDVAVIGGGITGVTTALLLKRAGKKVALVEGLRLGAGETGNSTAHLTSVLDTRYHRLISDFGVHSARLAADTHRIAIDRIEEWVGDLQIACQFERLPGFLYTEQRTDVADLKREYRAMQRLGFDVGWMDRPFLPFMQAQAAIRVPQQAQLDPRAYLLALARQIPGNGSHVFETTHVHGFTDAEPCVLFTASGRVEAREVVFATHAPVASPYRLVTEVAAYRTYALAVELERKESWGGLFWDTARPYHYLRDAEIGGRRMLIVGGGDHKTGAIDDTSEPWALLEAYSRARFKGVTAVPHRWSGQILQPVDGLAYIGRVPLSKRHYLATGYAGNGITYGTIAGMMISDLLLGRGSAWERLYDPGRLKPLASFRGFFAENQDYPKCLLRDRVSPAEAASVDEVGAGEGKITEFHGKKAAVYRDDNGVLHALSPVCTHLGCHVRFNAAEKSWDCPCHGSRFGVNGAVLCGPATRALEQLRVPPSEQRGEEPAAEPAA